MLNTRPTRRFRSSTLDGFDVQRHVIGALLIRELHTRYGRDNIGSMWMFLEPLLLAVAVAFLHANGGNGHPGSDIRIIPFALTGYTVFMIFRSIVTRAESALEANRPLLFHHMVTIFDLLFSRALLELIATAGALALLFSLAVATGLAEPPGRPLRLMSAIVLLAWFAFALSMGIATGVHFSKAFSKFVHPATYIAMPLSGAFFLLEWIPQPYRTWLSWSPLNQIFEMVHSGVFKSYDSPYFDPLYIIGWCMVLTVLGFLLLRVLRRHLHLS
ncbi:ABC transporter permease [Sphingobium sp. CFD-2]|jgi:capsular polysaccharide transport system permease protein|uniref:ABC transporter permease n=1 Tax=Sphingobium sp. CFD-2 TaxID=2878542 RepID=UPI00214B1287|nr:ABC transporter permease [Sphingobium sp. CFD-2]TNE30061.1 MAG: ABC transporter [Alphaproteobacteria bacterium]TNF05226.1 MAG: ABC transporter [Sphingomonadales bacterium]